MRDVQTTVNYIINRIDAESAANDALRSDDPQWADGYRAGLEYAKVACIEATTRTKEPTM